MIFFVKLFRHAIEIVEAVVLVISWRFIVIVIKARLKSNLNFENTYNKRKLFCEVKREHFDHLRLLFKFSRINTIANINLEVFQY